MHEAAHQVPTNRTSRLSHFYDAVRGPSIFVGHVEGHWSKLGWHIGVGKTCDLLLGVELVELTVVCDRALDRFRVQLGLWWVGRRRYGWRD